MTPPSLTSKNISFLELPTSTHSLKIHISRMINIKFLVEMT